MLISDLYEGGIAPCAPDRFPDLMAAVIERRDVGQRAAGEGIVTAHGAG